MSWRDREYNLDSFRSRAEALGIRRPPRVTLTLMVLHGAAFFLMLLVARGAIDNLGPVQAYVNPAVHPLGILLHPFATTNFLSTLLTAIALWSLGQRLEADLGPGRFLAIYIGATVAAGVAFFLVAQARPLLGKHVLDYPVGALAAMCVIIARRLRWESTMVLGWRTVSVGTLYLACAGLVVVLALLAHRAGATAWLLAALAGAGLGYASEVVNLRWPARRGPSVARRTSLRRPVRTAQRPPVDPDEGELDRILAKISRQGIASLTDAERQALEEARRAKMQRER